MADNAFRTALITLHLSVLGVIGLRALVTAVPIGQSVISISISTAPKMPTWITGLRWLIPVRALTLPFRRQKWSRRQVSRKISKKKAKGYKKRIDCKYLQGRTYKDYKEYISENPDTFVIQMDTVYNDETNGPFIPTFKFINAGLLFAVFHDDKTSESMKQGVDLLESILGTEVFRKYVHVLLTDRGSEFTCADATETDSDGTRRTRVFYCDPMQSWQKGTLENKHIELRYILPKGTDLKALGLTSQEKLNLVLSHVDSAPVEKLGGRSPLELAEFLYHDLYEKLEAYGIHKIEKDKVILKPYLLKK